VKINEFICTYSCLYIHRRLNTTTKNKRKRCKRMTSQSITFVSIINERRWLTVIIYCYWLFYELSRFSRFSTFYILTFEILCFEFLHFEILLIRDFFFELFLVEILHFEIHFFRYFSFRYFTVRDFALRSFSFRAISTPPLLITTA